MSTIALALHVVRRDLVQRRWIVAGWLVVVALATYDAVAAAPVPEAAGPRLFLLPLGAIFLAAGISRVSPPEGAPPGTPAYWRTLPIPLRALLLGRIAAAALLLCMVPLVGQTVALVALDTPATHIPRHLGASAVPLSGVVLGGLLVGSLTRGIGGAAVLVTGLYLLMLPLAFAVAAMGAGPGLPPPVPGLSLVLHLGVAGLALWMLALRHALDPGNWWTRIGATVAVLVLVGVSQTGWLVGVSDTGTSTTSPAQAGAPSFPVAVDRFVVRGFGTSLPGTAGGSDGSGGPVDGALGDTDALVEVRFIVRPGEEAPTPSLALVNMVTLEDRGGRILLSQRDPGLPRFSEPSTYVDISIPGHHLQAIRSGDLVLVVHGRGLELEAMIPLELPLKARAHASRGGHRVVVEEITPTRLTLRWSAFTSRVRMLAPGRWSAGIGASPGSSFLEAELVELPGGAAQALSRQGASGSFGLMGGFDLVVAGPTRGNHTISFVVPAPVAPDARLRVHTLEPTRITPFRFEIPASSWEGQMR